MEDLITAERHKNVIVKKEEIHFEAWVESHNGIGEKQKQVISNYRRSEVVRLLQRIGIEIGWNAPYSWKTKNFPLSIEDLRKLECEEYFRMGEFHYEPILFFKKSD